MNSYIVSGDTRSTQLAAMGVPGATGAAVADGDAEDSGDAEGETDGDTDGDTEGDGDELTPADARGDGVGASSAEHPAKPRVRTPTPTNVNANRETTTPRFSDKPTTFLLQLFMSSSLTSTPGLTLGARSGRDRIIDRDPR
ncbi:hypothetical protein ABIB15_002669 [Marisediminicola sp. UYEF4]|uniref:hypothetical protein n=1 Tax=Marisediminicola sp. UYEF4 TaxID=1756384 RepID=UPI0033986FB5